MISGKGSNISKTCVFIFHHSIQHDEASGNTFFNKLIAQINIFKQSFDISVLQNQTTDLSLSNLNYKPANNMETKHHQGCRTALERLNLY